MPLVKSLIAVLDIVKKYLPTAEYYADKASLIIQFSESDYSKMSADDKRAMIKNGWRYDDSNDCWTVCTDF